MAIAIAQSTKATKTSTAGTTQTLAFVSNTVTGNTVIVATNYDSGATTAVTGVTVGGVAMTEIGHKVEGGGAIANVALWMLKNVTGATTPSVVVTLSSGLIGGMIIAEISGVDTTSPLDGTTVTASDGTATATLTGAYTNTNANAIIFASMGTGDSGNTYTATNGGTVLQQQKVGVTVDMALTYKIVSAVAANTMSATISNPSDWAIVINGLKQATSGSVLTKTQASTARISESISKTQLATSRINNTLTKTQPAVGRVQVVIAKTQTSIAKIAGSSSKTQTSIARVTRVVTKPQTSTARISESITKIQVSVSRLSIVSTKTQPAISRITATVTRTQASIARIQKTLTKTQSSVANIITNRITDPGFETSIGSWGVYGGTSSVSRSTTVAHTGSSSLQLTGDGTAAAGMFLVVSGGTAGDLNRFKVWVRGDANTAGKSVIAIIKDEVGGTSQTSVPVILDATVWKQIWVTSRAPSTGNISVQVQGVDLVAGSVYLDDVVLDRYTIPSFTVSGRTISKDSVTTYYRGWNYSNIAQSNGPGTAWTVEKKQVRYDMEDITAGGSNMVKIYYDGYSANDYIACLDECYRNGIDVMMTYFVPQSSDYSVATGGTNRTTQTNNFSAMVTNLKYHPAIAAFAFGSEMNYNLGVTPKGDWYSLLNSALSAGKTSDNGKHLFTTSNGETADIATYNATVTNIDFWGATIYRGPNFTTLASDVTAATTRPFVITEYGFDRYNSNTPGEDASGQAVRNLALTKDAEVNRSVIAGHLIFEWSDEWWKMVNNGVQDTTGVTSVADDRDGIFQEEWFGSTVALATGSATTRTKKQSYTDLKTYYLNGTYTQEFAKTQTSTAKIVAGSVLTKTQTSISRITTNVTKTQTGTARLQVTAVKTQPSVARITESLSKTQTAIARITSIGTKTQTATARITETLSKTQTATARISIVATKTQAAIARISASVTKSQNSTARLRAAVARTQSSMARITEAISKTQTAVARVQLTATKTQSATARITEAIAKTQTAVARIATVVTKTQTATARIVITLTKTQTAVSRVAATITKTQAATGRIQATVTKTQTAVAKITTSFTKTQTAIARVSATATKTQIATARIASGLTKTQSAISRISTVVTKTQTAAARVTEAITKTQTATAKIAGSGSYVNPLLVQTKLGTSANSTTNTIAPTNNIVLGNMLILLISVDSQVAVSSVTGGNTWTKAVSQSQSGFSACNTELWYAPITGGGGTKPTITVTLASSAGFNLILREYSGLASSPLDVTASNSDPSTPTGSENGGTTVATSQPVELVVGGIEGRGGTGSWTYTAGTGYGNIAQVGTIVAGTFAFMSLIDSVTSSAATQSATWTSSDSNVEYTAVTATFKAAATGTSKTQPATARVQVTATKTQTATARITKSIAKTQTATGRVQATVTKTQTAVAKITTSFAKTQPATARVSATVTKTQTSTGRVQVTNTKIQTAISRITGVVVRTQTATGRVSTTVTKTQPAVARVQATLTKTQTATARLQSTFTKTQTATSRITEAITKTQTATARVQATVTKTQTATARIGTSTATPQRILFFFGRRFTIRAVQPTH